MSINTNVILFVCGSFNPPTIMHLRMFEIARDHLHRLGCYTVIGGVMSPVHDGYGKKELAPAEHRREMLKLALQNSDWIKISEWESRQENWSRTQAVLDYHQNCVNSVLKNYNNDLNENDLQWVPADVRNGIQGPIQVKLLCGADVLESFGVPGLWAEEDIESIVGHHGLVSITREGSNPMRFIYESDLLTKYMSNIIIVTEWITNEVSSTKIRKALRRSESVKYLLSDAVIEYIHQNGMYGSSKKRLYLDGKLDKISKYLSPIDVKSVFLTPSPDMPMESSPIVAPAMYGNFVTPIKTVDEMNKINSNVSTRPGQAVKIVTAVSGNHTIVKDEVCSQTVNCKIVTVISEDLKPAKDETDSPKSKSDKILKSVKSCQNFAERTNLSGCSKNYCKSNAEISDRVKRDNNLIKFVFTKQGIQVLSDIETVV